MQSLASSAIYNLFKTRKKLANPFSIVSSHSGHKKLLSNGLNFDSAANFIFRNIFFSGVLEIRTSIVSLKHENNCCPLIKVNWFRIQASSVTRLGKILPLGQIFNPWANFWNSFLLCGSFKSLLTECLSELSVNSVIGKLFVLSHFSFFPIKQC